jgi:DNA (cytosine-5)-methyltransferase 1
MMIKVSTVCSGIGAPEQAIKNLKVPHKVVFACEKDKYARQTYEANHNAEQFYDDMTTEEWDKPEQYSDLFIGKDAHHGFGARI